MNDKTQQYLSGISDTVSDRKNRFEYAEYWIHTVLMHG